MELQRKEQLVLSMEMDHALAIEDSYMNVSATQFGYNERKVKQSRDSICEDFCCCHETSKFTRREK